MRKISIILLLGMTAFASCNKKDEQISPVKEVNKGKLSISPSPKKDKNGPDDDEELILQIHGVEVVYENNPREGELVKLFKGVVMIDSKTTDSLGKFNFDVPADVYHIEIDPVDLPLHITDTFTVSENVDVAIELTN